MNDASDSQSAGRTGSGLQTDNKKISKNEKR